MRSFFILFAMLLCTAVSAQAQSPSSTAGMSDRPMSSMHTGDPPMNMSTMPDDAPFGYYGYKHRELHRFGSIDRLMAVTGKNCCDGIDGGECRATRLHFEMGKWYAELDGQRCAVTGAIHYDVPLPNDVEAIVCAPRVALDPVTGRAYYCPAPTYCVAGTIGS
jgi:hypothetical protein